MVCVSKTTDIIGGHHALFEFHDPPDGPDCRRLWHRYIKSNRVLFKRPIGPLQRAATFSQLMWNEHRRRWVLHATGRLALTVDCTQFSSGSYHLSTVAWVISIASGLQLTRGTLHSVDVPF